MKKITSAGIITYRDKPNSQREYLVLKYADGHWDLPKGKVEQTETLEQAALRELEEEAGIKARIGSSFKESLEYYFSDKDGMQSHKKVIFFVGKAHIQDTVTLSHEHTDFAWLSYKKTVKMLTYKNAQEIVMKAEKFLNTQAKLYEQILSH